MNGFDRFILEYGNTLVFALVLAAAVFSVVSTVAGAIHKAKEKGGA